MKNFEIASVPNSRVNGFPVIEHVITQVKPEKNEKKGRETFTPF